MRNKLFMMFAIAVAMLSSSCEKEEPVERGCLNTNASNFCSTCNQDDGSCEYRGCINSNASNYCSTCNKDDGSCQYVGKGLFWWDGATSEDLIDGESYSVTFYVDGQIIGSSGTNVFWNSAPNCDQTGTISFTKNLGNATSKSFNYRVVDQDGYEYFNTTITLTANGCARVKLF
jgi:hypothetical protein